MWEYQGFRIFAVPIEAILYLKKKLVRFPCSYTMSKFTDTVHQLKFLNSKI